MTTTSTSLRFRLGKRDLPSRFLLLGETIFHVRFLLVAHTLGIIIVEQNVVAALELTDHAMILDMGQIVGDFSQDTDTPGLILLQRVPYGLDINAAFKVAISIFA